MQFTSDARNGFAHLGMVGIVADAIVHGIDAMHHQANCHLVLLVQAIQEKGLGSNSRRIAFLQIGGEHIMYKRTPQYMFNAIFRVFPLAEQTNAT